MHLRKSFFHSKNCRKLMPKPMSPGRIDGTRCCDMPCARHFHKCLRRGAQFKGRLGCRRSVQRDATRRHVARGWLWLCRRCSTCTTPHCMSRGCKADCKSAEHMSRTHTDEQTRRHGRKGECDDHTGAIPNKTHVQYVPASKGYTGATRAWHDALSGACLSGSACRTKASISE